MKKFVNIKQLNDYIVSEKLKIKQWEVFKKYLLDHKIKATQINYLKSSLPKHWSEVLMYVINYVTLLDKGIVVNED